MVINMQIKHKYTIFLVWRNQHEILPIETDDFIGFKPSSLINFLIKRNQKKYFKKYTKEEQTNWELYNPINPIIVVESLCVIL